MYRKSCVWRRMIFIQTADGLSQTYPRDDLTDNALVTKGHRIAAEWLILLGSSWRR